MKKILVGILMLISLSACSVSNEQFLAAQKACEPYGGVGYLEPSNNDLFFTTCKDGTSINGITR